jgi:hypothetical protein
MVNKSKFPRKINIEHNSGVRKKTNQFDIELGEWIQNAIDKGWISLSIIESTTRNARAFTELRSEIYENDSLVDGQVAEVQLWATQFLDTPSVARKGQAIVNLIRNHENSKVELSTRKLDDSNITSFLLESPESGDSEATLVADKLTINTNIINFTNLPEYADDTAAGIGGLVVGDLYSTSGAVMIKL